MHNSGRRTWSLGMLWQLENIRTINQFRQNPVAVRAFVTWKKVYTCLLYSSRTLCFLQGFF